MPTKQNPRNRRKKALPTPDDLTGYSLTEVCFKIPDIREYRAAVLGQISALGYTTAWRYDEQPGSTNAKDTAELFRQVLAEHPVRFGDDCGEGSGEVIFELGADCILYYSNDLGETWLPVTGWSTNSLACFKGDKGDQGIQGIQGVQGIQGEPGEDGICQDCGHDPSEPPITDLEGQKCAVAVSYVEYLQDWTDYMLDVVEFGTSIAGMAQAALDFGGDVGGLMSNIVDLINHIIGVGVATIRVATTPAYWEEVQCWLFCNLPDDLVLTDDWRDEFRTWLYTLSIPGQFTAFAEDNFGLNGLNQRLFAASLTPDPACAAICDPCDTGAWCHTWLSGDGNTPNMTLVPARGISLCGTVTGYYDAVNDWYGGNYQCTGAYGVPPLTDVYAVRVKVTLPGGDSNINRIRMEYETNDAHPTNSVALVYDASNNPIVYSASSSGEINYGYTPAGRTELNFEVRVFIANGTSEICRIKKITIEGDGTNPFGSSNCTPTP